MPISPTRSTRLLSALLLAGLLALFVPVVANAGTTVHVDSAAGADTPGCGSDADPCATLDHAANAVASPGDTLDVASGSYAGTTIDAALRLVGPHAGTPGSDRGTGAAGAATITGTLELRAGAIVDGFRFVSGPDGAFAVQLSAPTGGGVLRAATISNNVFVRTNVAPIISSTDPSEGTRIADNLFVNRPGGDDVAVYLHGEAAAEHIVDATVQGNDFRDFTNATPGIAGFAIDAGGVPGLRVLDNRTSHVAGLLAISETNGGDGRVIVRGNVGTDFTGVAIRVGVGTTFTTIERNRLREGAAAAVQLYDGPGAGTTHDVQVLGNDIEGFESAIYARGAAHDGAVLVRGNRFVDTRQGGFDIVNVSPTADIDARNNWWGSSSAQPLIAGVADVRDPLRLVGLFAPASLRIGGTGVVRVHLVGAVGDAPAAAAGWFSAAFTTSNATVADASAEFEGGVAVTQVTAGATPGSTVTSATFDGETVSATTTIVGDSTAVDDGEAEPDVAAGPATRPRLVSTVELIGSSDKMISKGIRMSMFLHRIVVVRMTATISHQTAVNLGLRPANSALRTRMVVGTSYTRVKPGRHTLIVRLRPRYAAAVARIDRMVGVRVQSVFTAPRLRRVDTRRVELPAGVH